MNSAVFEFSLWPLRICFLALFTVSVYYCWRQDSPKFIRTFPVYCFINLIVEVLEYINPAMRNLYYECFTIFELYYFSFFLGRLIDSVFIKYLVYILDFYFLSFLIVISILRMNNWGNVSVIFESFILIIPCLVYFKEMFKKLRIIEPKHDPSFWMVSGIMIYFFTLIPTVWFSGYYSSINRLDISYSIYSINNYAQIISSIVFIKGMSCTKASH